MAEEKTINQVFPDEILEKILKYLNIESLSFARRTCQRLMKIVDNFTSKISNSTTLPDQKCQMYLQKFTGNLQFKHVFDYYPFLNRTLEITPIY